jgi:hypothetical protein
MHALIKVMAAAVLFGGGFVANEIAQDEKQDGKEPAGMMAPEPTDMHKWLAEGAGKWKCKGTVMMGPGQEMPMSGVQTNTMQEGGLWQIIDYKDDSGHFFGHGIAGYDVVKKQFVSVWVDNMGAELAPATGVLSEDKKTLTMRFQITDPHSGQKVDVTETMTRKDKDTVTFQVMHARPDTKSMKVLDLTYTRM